MKGSALSVKVLHGPSTPWSLAANQLEGRCDSIAAGVGCVNPKAFAGVGFIVARNPLVEDVAKHVFDAQAQLPSHWGVYPNAPVSRTTDQAIIDANRNTACPPASTPGLPYECDEYPMASTNQGASRVAVGDWSSRTVLKSANDSQGGLLSGAFNRFRILNNDSFFVLAQLRDGRGSW